MLLSIKVWNNYGEKVMAKSNKQKMKLFYLAELFWKRTDENHVISMKEMIAYLGEKGILAERKSIYDDIEVLKEIGFSIAHKKTRPAGYYLERHFFEQSDLNMLLDALQSSHSVTGRKVNELREKLKSFCSVWQEDSLNGDIYVSHRIHAMSDSIYHNICVLRKAISMGRKITFRYNNWVVDREEKLKRNGTPMAASPWRIGYTGGKHYMIAYLNHYERVESFWIDSMSYIRISDEVAEGIEQCEHMDLKEYDQHFGMYGGTLKTIRFYMANYLLDTVLEQFGKHAWVQSDGSDHFILVVNVSVGQELFGWIASMGKGAKILEPVEVKEQYREYLKELLEEV